MAVLVSFYELNLNKVVGGEMEDRRNKRVVRSERRRGVQVRKVKSIRVFKIRLR